MLCNGETVDLGHVGDMNARGMAGAQLGLADACGVGGMKTTTARGTAGGMSGAWYQLRQHQRHPAHGRQVVAARQGRFNVPRHELSTSPARHHRQPGVPAPCPSSLPPFLCACTMAAAYPMYLPQRLSPVFLCVSAASFHALSSLSMCHLHCQEFVLQTVLHSVCSILPCLALPLLVLALKLCSSTFFHSCKHNILRFDLFGVPNSLL